MGHVRYINILTWLRSFQDKLLFLVLFSLYPSLFWELRDKTIANFDPKASEQRWNIDIDRGLLCTGLYDAFILNFKLSRVTHWICALTPPYLEEVE